jgi:hypothetical protein
LYLFDVVNQLLLLHDKAMLLLHDSASQTTVL